MEFGKDVGGEAEETRLVSTESMTAAHRGRLGSFIFTGGAANIGLWDGLKGVNSRDAIWTSIDDGRLETAGEAKFYWAAFYQHR